MPIRAKAPVGRVPTNPSLKAGVSDGLIVRLSSRRSLNWALVLVKTGISPDSACTKPVEVPDLQSACTEPVEVSDNKLVQIIYCQSLMGICLLIIVAHYRSP